MKNTNTSLPLLKEAELERLRQLAAFMLGHLHQRLTILKLSGKVGINRGKLKQQFKRAFGITIHQYLMQERMQQAKSLLVSTDEPLKKIAALVGYSERNFYAIFKKFYGHTPDALRKE